MSVPRTESQHSGMGCSLAHAAQSERSLRPEFANCPPETHARMGRESVVTASYPEQQWWLSERIAEKSNASGVLSVRDQSWKSHVRDAVRYLSHKQPVNVAFRNALRAKYEDDLMWLDPYPELGRIPDRYGGEAPSRLLVQLAAHPPAQTEMQLPRDTKLALRRLYRLFAAGKLGKERLGTFPHRDRYWEGATATVQELLSPEQFERLIELLLQRHEHGGIQTYRSASWERATATAQERSSPEHFARLIQLLRQRHQHDGIQTYRSATHRESMLQYHTEQDPDVPEEVHVMKTDKMIWDMESRDVSAEELAEFKRIRGVKAAIPTP
jgi:hypothetical protein